MAGLKPDATLDGEILVGQTLAVQEFEEASIRDFGRPVREMKIGMLPIQLAKIMINLARVPLNATILDPFCGFGTILAEAHLMGYQNLIGSDLEQKMIDATRKNLIWLANHVILSAGRRPQSKDLLRMQDIKLFQSSAQQLAYRLPPRSVDAIVTEPYLGPVTGIKNYELRIKNELENLYLKSFEEFKKILKPGGRVVFIFPAFSSAAHASATLRFSDPPKPVGRPTSSSVKTSAPILAQLKKQGFTPIQLLPQDSAFCILHSALSITYSRPNQRVLREIFVFKSMPQLQ